MKHRALKFLLVPAIILVPLVAALWVTVHPPKPESALPPAVATTRQLLRQQGLKTDLSDFDFSSAPELRAREMVLSNTIYARFVSVAPEHPSLMQPIGNGAAQVIWKSDSLKTDFGEPLSWDELQAAVTMNQALYDPACMAILSGPIHFDLDTSRGVDIRLPHLAIMKNLEETMNERLLLALHDGNQEAAWTNLMAATRLVTAWELEPTEMSHLVWFVDNSLAFNAMWQALQSNRWPDARLAQLQQEWESVNFFAGLPEIAAFTRAGGLAAYEQDRLGLTDPAPTLSEWCRLAKNSPVAAWNELTYRWKARGPRRAYPDDEKALMFFYRDREMEIRDLVKAPAWITMRELPGVTNYGPFQSASHAPALMRIGGQFDGHSRFNGESPGINFLAGWPWLSRYGGSS